MAPASPSRSRSRKRRPSSRQWLERQHRDPYVAEARRQGYRSRAAWKLRELDEKFALLRPGQIVVDLGAAPGGWAQVAVAKTGAAGPGGRRAGQVLAVDKAPVEPLEGADILALDLLEEAAPGAIRDALGGRPADLVLSDMAPATIGHPATDHLRIMALAEAALDLACGLLKPGGGFVCKLFQGAEEKAYTDSLRRCFAKVRLAKPPSSRRESTEIYAVATGFSGHAACG
ncbi:MAG: 23S rRNA methyltransferase [Alphaproteobacteria bacterium]|jgi:23S rRNA (uridine2552-2'-O)-methyltransferase|nr:23S rRNA methyltransferase [Alphaproteobacteria bacterium]